MANAMMCYTVFNKSEKVIFQSPTAPIDMSQPMIGTAVQNKFGADTFMIFNDNQVCTDITVSTEETPSKITVPASTPAPAVKSN